MSENYFEHLAEPKNILAEPLGSAEPRLKNTALQDKRSSSSAESITPKANNCCFLWHCVLLFQIYKFLLEKHPLHLVLKKCWISAWQLADEWSSSTAKSMTSKTKKTVVAYGTLFSCSRPIYSSLTNIIFIYYWKMLDLCLTVTTWMV